jgi:hypothetical protein
VYFVVNEKGVHKEHEIHERLFPGLSSAYSSISHLSLWCSKIPNPKLVLSAAEGSKIH